MTGRRLSKDGESRSKDLRITVHKTKLENRSNRTGSFSVTVHPQPCTGSTGRFEQENFKENTELIYERISVLKTEIEGLTRRGSEPEPQRKEHLEDELFKLYRHLIDQKDRWADRRTEIDPRIRDLQRQLQGLEDSSPQSLLQEPG